MNSKLNRNERLVHSRHSDKDFANYDTTSQTFSVRAAVFAKVTPPRLDRGSMLNFKSNILFDLANSCHIYLPMGKSKYYVLALKVD